MEHFLRKAWPAVAGSWKHQCRCGDVRGRYWRGAWWCATCGRIKWPIDGTDGRGKCGCHLCGVMIADQCVRT